MQQMSLGESGFEFTQALNFRDLPPAIPLTRRTSTPPP